MLNIAVLAEDQQTDKLADALSQVGHRCLPVSFSNPLLPWLQLTQPDMLVISVAVPADTLLADLHAVNRQAPLPVVLFTKTCLTEHYSAVVDAQVSAFVVDGLSYPRLPGIIQLALARFSQLQALKNALEEARGQLEDRKQIDRAKAILIKTRNFTENDAYHTLRKLAMDRNVTLGEMARNVIAMADLLK